VRKDGRIVDEEKWQEKLYNGKKWKKLLRKARNRSTCQWNKLRLCIKFI
jgi:hypothetical protein